MMVKLDANDQKEIAEQEIQKIKKLLDELAKINPPVKTKKIEWPQAASVIAGNIAIQFFQTTSLFNADLRRLIIEAIEQDRKHAQEYLEK